MDYLQYAKNLQIIPVHQRGNSSGFLTPKELYQGYKPFSEQVEVIHATVGVNTLPYFADRVNAQGQVIQKAGSVHDGRLVCAHQLIPKDAHTIYDMVPAGYGCGHAGTGRWKGHTVLNRQSRGYELENRQDGVDPFTEAQYIKLALSIAYNTAVARVPNTMIVSHFQCDPSRRSDPDSGPFSWYAFYSHLYQIRQDRRIFQQWGVPIWTGE